MSTVEPYQRRNSVMDPHINFIRELRRLGWPYNKIVIQLSEQRGITVHVSQLYNFCVRRGIAKRQSPTPEQQLLRDWVALAARINPDTLADDLERAHLQYLTDCTNGLLES